MRFLVLSIGNWLYRSLPAELRKSVAAILMIAGGLMLASLLLRQYGVVSPGAATDVACIVLFILGALVFVSGLALLRRTNEGEK